MGYTSPYIAPPSLTVTAFLCDSCLLKIWSKTGDPYSHTCPCVICSGPHFITTLVTLQLSVSEWRRSHEELHGWRGNLRWVWLSRKKTHLMKEMGSWEPDFRHRAWHEGVLKCAEMMYGLVAAWKVIRCVFLKKWTGWTRKWVHLSARDPDLWSLYKPLGNWTMVKVDRCEG